MTKEKLEILEKYIDTELLQFDMLSQNSDLSDYDNGKVYVLLELKEIINNDTKTI